MIVYVCPNTPPHTHTLLFHFKSFVVVYRATKIRTVLIGPR